MLLSNKFLRPFSTPYSALPASSSSPFFNRVKMSSPPSSSVSPFITTTTFSPSHAPSLPPSSASPPFVRASANIAVNDDVIISNSKFHSVVPYSPPAWAQSLSLVPSHIVRLAMRPSPIHRWHVPFDLPEGTKLYIKRDDLTGMELSGNKVRKLEFLLAEALRLGSNSVVTIGGIQSNHCRATAVAARTLGMEPHLILRTSKSLVDSDPGLVGNLLLERVVGSHIHLVSKEEYAKMGGERLGEILVRQLEEEGGVGETADEKRRPYLIPVGGSNALGTWGYVECAREIESQLSPSPSLPAFDYISMACGSGGTLAGLALGCHLSSLNSKVLAFSVCDSPDYFFDFTQDLLDGVVLGEKRGGEGEKGGEKERILSRDIMQIIDSKGEGYAVSRAEELSLLKSVAVHTGVVLDPVYSGKALFGLLQEIRSSPQDWRGKNILFIHTGGVMGLFDKTGQIAPLLSDATKEEREEGRNGSFGSWRRMDVSG